jgi:hypothetical protein
MQLISANLSGRTEALTVPLKAPKIASENTSADEVSKIFGAVIEEDKAMKGWQTFSDRVGWRQNGTWIASNTVSPQIAPDGHFPTPLWLASWHQSKDPKAKEFQAQYAALLAKIASCNIN